MFLRGRREAREERRGERRESLTPNIPLCSQRDSEDISFLSINEYLSICH